MRDTRSPAVSRVLQLAPMRSLGLTQVPTQRLKYLLTLVHRGQIAIPLSGAGLMLAGLEDISDAVTSLKTLDAQALQVVLVAVLAERGVGGKSRAPA